MKIENKQPNNIEIVNINNDVKVFCITAKSFPDGILDAHEKLHEIIPLAAGRRYFGVSRPEAGVIVYKAAAEELDQDKKERFNCEISTIQKGKYRCLTVLEYAKDLQSIGKAFNILTSYSDIDPKGYCIEWYYDEQNVRCMIRLKDNCEAY